MTTIHRSRRGPARILIALVLFCLASAAWAQGTVLYDQTFTGAELLSAPGVSFPTRAPVVNGNSIDFGAGTTVHEVMMRLPVAVADCIPPGTPATLVVELDSTALTVDNDLGIVLGDGSIFAGALLSDNNGGGASLGTYLDTGSSATLNVLTLVFNGSGAPDDSITHVCTEPGSTTAFIARGSGSASLGVTPALDATQALGFSLLGNDASEQYRINSVRIRLIGGLPSSAVACEDIDPDAATVDPGAVCGAPQVPSSGIATLVGMGMLLLFALTGTVHRLR